MTGSSGVESYDRAEQGARDRVRGSGPIEFHACSWVNRQAANVGRAGPIREVENHHDGIRDQLRLKCWQPGGHPRCTVQSAPGLRWCLT